MRRDGLLPCAPVHGDMVATNIIREPNGRHVLVDWEHGQHLPVAFDVAKLLLTSGEPLEVNRQTVDHVGPFGDGPGRYAWQDQLALGLCRVLTWSGRRARAAAAGRLPQFEQERQAQLRLLRELLVGA